MTRESRDAAAAKADRALQLQEQGLSRSVIAERLSVPPKHIAGMIQRAKERRARKEAAE